MNNKFIDYVTNLAIDNKNKIKNKIHHHQAIMVKNGKIIGIGSNSLSSMNLLGNNCKQSTYIHAEIDAFKNYLYNHEKARSRFNRSKKLIKIMYHYFMIYQRRNRVFYEANSFKNPYKILKNIDIYIVRIIKT